MLFFNRQNNDDLILAIQAAGVSRGRNGFFASKAPKAMTEKTKAERNLPNQKKTSSNTAQTAQTLLIHSTSAARNFRITIASPSPCRAYRDSYSFCDSFRRECFSIAFTICIFCVVDHNVNDRTNELSFGRGYLMAYVVSSSFGLFSNNSVKYLTHW